MSDTTESAGAASHTSEALPTFAQIARPVLWLVGIGLSVLPPLLVVLERWFDLRVREILRSIWCKSQLLCESPLPSYFVWVIPAFGLFILLFLAGAKPHTEAFSAGQSIAPMVADERPGRTQRTAALIAIGLSAATALLDFILNWSIGRQPEIELALAIVVFLLGCWLLNTRLDAAWAAVRRVAAVAVPLGVGQLALIFLLRSVSMGMPETWLAAALTVVIFYFLLLRVKPPPVYWVVTGTLVLMCYRMSYWQFSVIGDEYSFYSYAAHHLQVDGFAQLSANLFGGRAVYQTHPFISSLIQMASMALFGVDNFGWRFSSIYLAAVSLFFFYDFFQKFLSRRVALWGVIFLGASQYLMTFGKIGYNNLQALFALGLVLWAAGKAYSSRSLVTYAGLGATMGLCFFLYPAAIYAVPLTGLFLLVFDPPSNRKAAGRWGLVLAGLIFFLIPLIFQPEYWLEKIPGTFLQQSEAVKSIPLGIHIGMNMLYSLFSFVYSPSETHYVMSSYIDPLSAALLPAGLAWTLRMARRSRFALFWSLGFIYMLFAVGASHDRPTPTTTRMFMLLPWFCLFAAFGLVWLAAEIRGRDPAARWRKVGVVGIAALTMTAMLVANLYMAYGLSRQRTVGNASLEVLFLRLLQRGQKIRGVSELNYLFITATDWGIDGFRVQRDVYDLPHSQAQLERVAVETPMISMDTTMLALREDTVVIVQPWLQDDLRLPVEVQLSGLGKLRCDVREAPEVNVKFSLWLSEKWKDFCPWNGDWAIPAS